MYQFGSRSSHELSTVHPDLQCIAQELIRHVNYTVINGRRGKKEQNKLYREGKTQLEYPKSKHNNKPSLAMDIMPYPVKPVKDERFTWICGIAKGIATGMDINIRIGTDWDGDGKLVKYDKEEDFWDAGHIELVGVSP